MVLSPKDMVARELEDAIYAQLQEHAEAAVKVDSFSRASRELVVQEPQRYALNRNGGPGVPLGAHPGNTGGKKKRSGAWPKSFVPFLMYLRESKDLQKSLVEIAKNPRARNFPALLKLLTMYDPEKPAAKKEVSGKTEIVVRFEREGRRITAG
jgi:hypothetical protein